MKRPESHRSIEYLLQILAHNTSLLHNCMQNIAGDTSGENTSGPRDVQPNVLCTNPSTGNNGTQYSSQYSAQSYPSMANFNAIVALSGGGDSVGLLCLYAQLRKQYPTMQISAAYVNHNIQSTEAQLHEQKIVKATCKALGIELFSSNAGATGTEALGAKTSASYLQSATNYSADFALDAVKNTEALLTCNELQARIFRYGELISLAKQAQTNCIITAHHAQDQYETLLMRIFEGRGLWGLGAIPNFRMLEDGPPMFVIRPCLSPVAIQRYLAKERAKTQANAQVAEQAKEQPIDLSQKTQPKHQTRLLPTPLQALNSEHSSINSEDLHYAAKWAQLDIHTDISNIHPDTTTISVTGSTTGAPPKANLRAKVRSTIAPAIETYFPNAVGASGKIANDFAQLMQDELAIANEYVWNIDAYAQGAITRLRMPTKVFASISYTKQHVVLFAAFNRLGQADVSAHFIRQIINSLPPNGFSSIMPKEFFIDLVSVTVTRNHIIIYKSCIEEAPIALASPDSDPIFLYAPLDLDFLVEKLSEYDTSSIALMHPRNNRTNMLHTKILVGTMPHENYALQYNILTKGSVTLDFVNKHDSIIRNNTKINVRTLLVSQMSTADWTLVPVLRDNEGVLAVLGEVVCNATIIRENAMAKNVKKLDDTDSSGIANARTQYARLRDTNATHKTLHLTILISYQKIVVAKRAL